MNKSKKSIVGYCEICGILPQGMMGPMGKHGFPGRSCVHGVSGSPGRPGMARLPSDVLSDEYTNDEMFALNGNRGYFRPKKFLTLFSFPKTLDVFDLYELCEIVKNSKGQKIVVHGGVYRYFIDLSEMNQEKKLILTKLWSTMLFGQFVAHYTSTYGSHNRANVGKKITAGTPLKYSITQTNGVYIYSKSLIDEYKKYELKVAYQLIEINNEFYPIDISYLSPKMMKIKTKLGTLEDVVATYDSHGLLWKIMVEKKKNWDEDFESVKKSAIIDVMNSPILDSDSDEETELKVTDEDPKNIATTSETK